jgi:MoaA/NifB/PqqE/SkfB family radical SAM enzyme
VQSPSFVTYLATWRCNARCVFCDIWKRESQKNEELTPEEVGRLFKQFKSIDVLRITGGEPFLRGDLAEVINQADQACRPSMIHLTSNGYLVDNIVKTVRAIKNTRKIHIKISIDSVGAKHDEVRGVPGMYERAMQSVRELVKLRESTGLHVGINQAIVEESELDKYNALNAILEPLGVPVYPVIAHKPTSSLYADTSVSDPTSSVEPFGTFSHEGLIRFRQLLNAKNKVNDDFKERLVDNYHVHGLCNRLIEGKNSPNPRCVALNSHLRVLPNGEIPVCLYNSNVIGSLRDKPFSEIWKGAEAEKQRKWVHRCPGCWQSCESVVNAIYTGDLVRGFFMKG